LREGIGFQDLGVGEKVLWHSKATGVAPVGEGDPAIGHIIIAIVGVTDHTRVL